MNKNATPPSLSSPLRTRILMLTWCSLVCVLCFEVGTTQAFRNGDIIRTLKQSHFNGVTLGWTEVIADDSPRFSQEHTFQLPSLASEPSDKAVVYKVAFSFMDEKYITPMITISDGKGAYIEAIKFTFVYSEAEIIDLRWSVDYNTDGVKDHLHQSDPTKFVIHYSWERFADKNADLGMSVLFFSGFFIGAALFSYVLIASGVETQPSNRLPTRAAPLTSKPPAMGTQPNYSNATTAATTAYEVPLRQRIHKPTSVVSPQVQPQVINELPSSAQLQEDSFADFVGSDQLINNSAQLSPPPSPIATTDDGRFEEIPPSPPTNPTPKYD